MGGSDCYATGVLFQPVEKNIDFFITMQIVRKKKGYVYSVRSYWGLLGILEALCALMPDGRWRPGHDRSQALQVFFFFCDLNKWEGSSQE